MSNNKVVVRRYDSIGEFSADLGTLKREHTDRHRSSDFNGNVTIGQVREGMLKGNLDEVPKAEALLTKLLDMPVEFAVAQWEQSVAGQMPCVPAYLAGFPEAMYRRVETQSERAPVKIYASVCVSAGLSTDELRKRGTAIMALAIRLAEIRPVELFLFADMGNFDGNSAFMPVIKVDTAPLDLCAVSYCFTHPGFLRSACFSWAERESEKATGRNWSGAWAWSSDPNSNSAKRRTTEALGAGPEDLVIPGGFSNDPMIKQPVEWLNDKLAKYMTTVEEL